MTLVTSMHKEIKNLKRVNVCSELYIMLITIKGYYENGEIILDEEPPLSERTEVIVIFLDKETASKIKDSQTDKPKN